jgi:hypothetical protein
LPAEGSASGHAMPNHPFAHQADSALLPILRIPSNILLASTMSRHLRLLLPAVFFLASHAGAAEPYELLFKGHIGKVSLADMKAIAAALPIAVSKDGSELEDSEDCGGPINYETHLEDLNHDGVPEVIVLSGNVCTSGTAGSSIHLFIKGRDGKYRSHLGFPASSYEKLSTSNKGFPDLTFGGPGFCHGVWRWDGNSYKYKCSMESSPGGCASRGVRKVCDVRQPGTSGAFP